MPCAIEDSSGRSTIMNDPKKHKLSEAVAGQTQASNDDQANPNSPREAGRPGSTPREVAEETRRGQESRDSGKNDVDRDDHLVRVGRGQQTHG